MWVDFDAVFFIEMLKTGRVTWAKKKSQKVKNLPIFGEKTSFLRCADVSERMNLARRLLRCADLIERMDFAR